MEIITLKRHASRAAVCVGALLATMITATSCSAGSSTGQLAVSVTVQGGCSIENSDLRFGSYVAGQAEPLDSVGELRYRSCTGTLSIGIDGGQSGNIAQRTMTAGGQSIRYQLYQDTSRINIWGVNANSNSISVVSATSGGVRIYGRIPAGQNPPAGIYDDVVNITLNF